MSATERAKALRAELAETEAQAKAERTAERQSMRESQRADDIAKTEAFRDENYELTVGAFNNYIGASSTYNGGIEIDITEWTTPQTSVALSRDEVLALIEGLQKLVK